MASSSLPKLITQFLEDLEITKGRSDRTIRNYGFYLGRFVEWAAENGITAPEKIGNDDIRNFRLWLNRLHDPIRKVNLKKNTQNYHLIALRSFLKYLAKRDIKTLAPEKIELAKTDMRQVDFVEGSDLDNLLDMPLKTDAPPIIKLRDKAVLELLFSTGLRVSELAALTRDLNIAKDEFTVKGKGGKTRIVFMSNQARHSLVEYLKQRKDNNPYLFIGHDKAASTRGMTAKIESGGKVGAVDNEYVGLTPRSIERMIHRYALMAGINKRVTPHTLRHSYATDLLMNGADLRSVQSLLGHASITTTQIYTHITNQQLKDVHKAFHDRNRKKK